MARRNTEHFRLTKAQVLKNGTNPSETCAHEASSQTKTSNDDEEDDDGYDDVNVTVPLKRLGAKETRGQEVALAVYAQRKRIIQ